MLQSSLIVFGLKKISLMMMITRQQSMLFMNGVFFSKAACEIEEGAHYHNLVILFQIKMKKNYV